MPEPECPDPAADLVRRAVCDYESLLTGYVRNLTGDPGMARDVVQDSFIKLYAQDPARLDGPVLKAWLFTVCRHRALELLRRRRRLVSLENPPMDLLVDPEPAPDRHTADPDETVFVLQTLRLLPLNQAEVLRLKFQSDLSYQEIADITGLSASNVGFLIHTGLRHLRTLPALAAGACQ